MLPIILAALGLLLALAALYAAVDTASQIHARSHTPKMTVDNLNGFKIGDRVTVQWQGDTESGTVCGFDVNGYAAVIGIEVDCAPGDRRLIGTPDFTTVTLIKETPNV